MRVVEVRDVDPLRRRMHIARSVTEDDGRLVWATTNTGKGRTVPLPRFLAEQIIETVAGKDPVDLVFGVPVLDDVAERMDVIGRATAGVAACRVSADFAD